MPLQIGELRLGVGRNGRQAVGRVIDQNLNLDLINQRGTAHLNLFALNLGSHKHEQAMETNLPVSSTPTQSAKHSFSPGPLPGVLQESPALRP